MFRLPRGVSGRLSAKKNIPKKKKNILRVSSLYIELEEKSDDYRS